MHMGEGQRGQDRTWREGKSKVGRGEVVVMVLYSDDNVTLANVSRIVWEIKT